MARRRPEEQLPTASLTWLLVTLAAVLAPHVAHLPPWIPILAGVAGLWRYQVHRRCRRLPPTLLLAAITLATTVAVILSYGELAGRDVGVALLAAMTALKLLEMRTRRDTVLVIFLGYFLVVTELLYSQSIPAAAYMVAGVWLLTTMLITVTRSTGDGSPLPQLRASAALLVQAAPLALVLFLLFPRIPGPLWGAPEGQRAVSGLSDSMAPGSITELSLSDAVAFRVRVEGPAPPPEQRYWRGPVLSRFDGRTWNRPPDDRREVPTIVDPGRTVRYTVTLEPHGRPWLPALELPATRPAEARLTGTAELVAPRAIFETRRYSLRSHLDYRLEPSLAAAARTRYLELPAGRHPQARRLADRWRSEADTPGDVVRRALDHFRDEPFVYTLRPPALPGDPVDDFLFGTRRGFCEHYASAFAVLMRGAGIPSRVVTGYQGGEANPHGDYLIVRQSDAHAWAEVWLAGQGWIRVDPTAAVSPARVELGLASAVPAGDPVPFMARGMGWLQTLGLRWDAVNALWDRWVLAYGPELQRRLMDRIGIDGWVRKAGALLAGIGGALALALALALWRLRPPPEDPAAAAWRRLSRKLARLGLGREPSEPPLAYARRLERAAPALAPELRPIIALYLELRYGATGRDRRRLRELRRRVARLRPSRA